MAYARFSSEDFASDVYVYESVEDVYVTELAHRRWIFTAPVPPQVEDPSDHLAQVQRYEEVLKMHGVEGNGYWEPTPEVEGGRSYEHNTAQECLANLYRVQAAGYRVPQGALDALKLEAEDQE